MALHFFGLWHLTRTPLPSFMPDFGPAAQNQGYGVYGQRDWYDYLLFPTCNGDPRDVMSYQGIFGAALACTSLTFYSSL